MARVERRDKHHPHPIPNSITIEGLNPGKGKGNSKGKGDSKGINSRGYNSRGYKKNMNSRDA